MMSSVIPARLEFQCGHAALVSLPRVKGESSAQRIDRIAREKTAAQVRTCDFCPPVLELVPQELAPAMSIVEPQAAPLVAPVTPVALPIAPVALPTAPVALPTGPVAVPVVAPVVTTITATPARTITRRVARPRQVTGHRFVVRFRTETVLHATDIRDALRQVESLGATEVLAINRTG